MEQINKLLEIMKSLRDPENGCPWDLEQNFSTIAPYTLEEAYEVADAISRDDMNDLCSELGDLLFQVIYHSQLADEQDAFNFEDVTLKIIEKLIRRHPHVFA
jgi:nucleoside triphosphate diphosphatase